MSRVFNSAACQDLGLLHALFFQNLLTAARFPKAFAAPILIAFLQFKSYGHAAPKIGTSNVFHILSLNSIHYDLSSSNIFMPKHCCLCLLELYIYHYYIYHYHIIKTSYFIFLLLLWLTIVRKYYL